MAFAEILRPHFCSPAPLSPSLLSPPLSGPFFSHTKLPLVIPTPRACGSRARRSPVRLSHLSHVTQLVSTWHAPLPFSHLRHGPLHLSAGAAAAGGPAAAAAGRPGGGAAAVAGRAGPPGEPPAAEPERGAGGLRRSGGTAEPVRRSTGAAFCLTQCPGMVGPGQSDPSSCMVCLRSVPEDTHAPQGSRLGGWENPPGDLNKSLDWRWKLRCTVWWVECGH